MTAAVRQLLNSFEALPAADQREALMEILRRTSPAPYGDLPDQALVEAAEDLFLGLDREESGHAAS